jgi:hypothetical protein
VRSALSLFETQQDPIVTHIHRFRFGLSLVLVSLFFARPAVAQLDSDVAPAKKPVPFAVGVVSSVERVFEKMDYMFDSIDRPELSDLVTTQLAAVRDLKGIDRNRPLGVLAFLKPGLFPQPAIAGFLPVDDFEEFLLTMSIGPSPPAKLPDVEQRYVLSNPGQDLYFEQIGDHVFLTNDESILDAELPDPDSYAKNLNTRYDAALQLNIGAIPSGMRTILLNFVRAAIEAEIQQKDEEPDGQYRLRKASGMSNLQFMEQLLMQGDSVTIGLDVSPRQKTAVVEIDLNARPGSQFAKYLSDSGGEISYFRPLQNDPTILSAYASWKLQRKDRDLFKEMALALKDVITHQLDTNPPEGDSVDVRVDGLFDSLADTAEAGILDGFFRFQGEQQGEVVVLAAIRVINGELASQTIGDLLQMAEAYSNSPRETEILLNVEAYRGVNFHRVTPDEPPDTPTKRTFGEDYSFYFGAGERTLWFVIGGDKAIPEARKAIDRILDPTSQRDLANTAPFRFTLNMSQWIKVWENPERERLGFRKTMSENFEKGDDRIVIDMTTRENGVRYRLQLEESFVRLLGLVITTQVLGLEAE